MVGIFFTLFIEFFKTGLFAIGGGLATIPFLHDMIGKYGWFTTELLTDMIAVSESTPGPIGINMATYVGFITGLKDFGIGGAILGAVIATIALVLPSLIIICIIAQFLKKFKESEIVQSIFYGLRPAVTALIASAGLGIFMVTLFSVDAFKSSGQILDFFKLPYILLFCIIFFISKKFKKLSPIILILFSAIIGVVFKL
ncbi:MAG: chromate transporter [Clostridium sp.]|uniref:chromate transporter n=1 Tax=Clostridium sp. TaxID=1506 RepID=UPI002A897F04|nr:chromate transporter [Clostridium sp.]MDY5097020.1 chromate transporter [Clostridium sp.]